MKGNETIINVESERSDDAYLFFTTRAGYRLRTSVKEFANIRQNGLKPCLKKWGRVINVFMTEKDTDHHWNQIEAMLFDSINQFVVWYGATGVKGIKRWWKVMQ